MDVIPEKATFTYRPWGGRCYVEWHGQEFWMIASGADGSGSKCFKTRNGAGLRLCQGEQVQVFWDNSCYRQAYMPDKKTICVLHGEDWYNFNMTGQGPSADIACISVEASGVWPFRTMTLVARDYNNDRELAREQSSGAETNVGVLHKILGHIKNQGYYLDDSSLVGVRHELGLNDKYEDRNWNSGDYMLLEAKQIAKLVIELKAPVAGGGKKK